MVRCTDSGDWTDPYRPAACLPMLLLRPVDTFPPYCRCRKRPLVLDLCLSLPRSVHSVTLTAQFTKAFLRMLEHPPDAHRGFDVPAAVVTVGDVPPGDVLLLSGDSATPPGAAAAGGADGDSSSSEQGGRGAWGRQWRVVVAEGVPGSEQELKRVTPLMAQLMQQRPPLVSKHSTKCLLEGVSLSVCVFCTECLLEGVSLYLWIFNCGEGWESRVWQLQLQAAARTRVVCLSGRLG